MANEKERLFSAFPPVSTEAWVAKITADLKGVPFEKKMTWHTNEGFDVKAFYRRENLKDLKTPKVMPAEYPYVRSTRMDNEWLVRQDIEVEDLKEANKKALDILNKGVTSLGFKIKRAHVNAESIETLLAGICPEAVELNFSCCHGVMEAFVPLLVEYFRKSGANLSECRGSVNYDAFKKPLQKGRSNAKWVEMAKNLMDAIKPLPRYRILNVNAYILNNAGAFITQELGYALAWGAEFVDKLTDAGLSVKEIASRIKFNFGVGANYFMELAKFRAARWLWAEIIGAYGDEYKNEIAKIHQHARTSEWNQTIFDSYVNMLRSQTEVMSASLAGVDSITVVPFDKPYKEPDDFSERIARNQQLLLKEESHFDKVIDPGAGSYYIEELTNSIATQAWSVFLNVIDEGGFTAAAEAGSVQKVINTSNSKRHQAIGTRKEVLLGTNQFPNFTEVAGDKIQKPLEQKSCCGSGHDCSGNIEKLNFSRGASDFEELRLATEHSGKQPKVFMLTIGNLAMRLARSQFSGNFFACAGYKIIDNLGFESVQAGVDAAMEAKADVIVLCSSDDEYEQYGPEAFDCINNRVPLVIAGNPACTEQLQEKGIKYFCHVRSNVLEMLREFNKILGVN
ncbi:methylmalonyl-CoA mutase [Porphyromonas macacae]|uniref:methylmalonyl-CoA mutase small subunit n=1 Tax=Porphyromonas macacae TaxID=28115 RepID=UPI00052B75FB|nr:methylmalonyl-CoA mutase small subunit [Porphyromonas macacae]KGN99568.1 methylmalonyl-CoA mutase [Porphyromonas macacae]